MVVQLLQLDLVLGLRRRVLRQRQQQPPRRGQLPVRRRQRAFPQVDDRAADLLVARDQGQRRGHLGRPVLIGTAFAPPRRVRDGPPSPPARGGFAHRGGGPAAAA